MLWGSCTHYERYIQSDYKVAATQGLQYACIETVKRMLIGSCAHCRQKVGNKGSVSNHKGSSVH